MKRALLAITVAACAFVSMSTAQADDFSINPVDSNGSTTVKTLFGFDETPFVHLHLPEPGLNFASSFWESPAGPFYFTSHGPSTDQDIWFSLSNWNTAKALGQWNVNGGYLYAQGISEGPCTGSCGAGYTSFTVTPEPASSALFLIGSLTLAAVARRKKSSTDLV